MRSPPAFAGVIVALAIFADVLPSPAAADIRFVHDASGRLISVIDLFSDFVVYRYDATGNLLSVTRQPSTTV
ncbi:MAG: RHS repeat domain-containing protein [Candidatus Rokuibacteriota bacterium]